MKSSRAAFFDPESRLANPGNPSYPRHLPPHPHRRGLRNCRVLRVEVSRRHGMGTSSDGPCVSSRGGWQRCQSVSWWLAFFDPVCVLLNPGSPSYLRRHSLLRLFGDKLSLNCLRDLA